MTNIHYVKSPHLQECVKAFEFNLNRTATFAFMPAEIAFMVRRDQIILDNAIFALTGKGEIQLSDFSKEAPPSGLQAEVDKQAMKIASLPPKEVAQLRGDLGVGYIDRLLLCHPAMHQSIDALLAFIVMGSWTAFEGVASDLWVVGVDKGPKEVAARLHLASNKLQKPDDNLTPASVYSLESDARTQFGSFLRETGKVSFQKLEHIKMYYAIAFGEECKKLFTDTAGGYIFALAAIRNALIHKSGIADKKFVEQVQRFPELKSIKAGQPILLDGELVKRLRLSALEVGGELFAYLDKLLSEKTS